MNNNILNRVFTKATLMDLINNESSRAYSSTINEYLGDSMIQNNADALSRIYDILLKSYRNEYIYKNTLLNKLLLGRHSVRTSTALTEVPVGKSKADFILINGCATVYEIKTELDSLDRLKGQLEDYYKAFAKVYVITSESYYKRISTLLEGTPVGILILTKRNTISEKKIAVEDYSKLCYEAMFKLLRKNEYEEIIKKNFGKLPDSFPVEYYKDCFNLFQKVELKVAYRNVLEVLKKRNKVVIENFKVKVPSELSSLVYFANFKVNEYEVLEKFLKDDYRG